MFLAYFLIKLESKVCAQMSSCLPPYVFFLYYCYIREYTEQKKKSTDVIMWNQINTYSLYPYLIVAMGSVLVKFS